MMLITVVVIRAKFLETTQCLSEDEWVNKMRYIHITEYYWAMKMKC